ncbi:hypothetical protein Ancab_023770 [Ancistrocladus abbreviatus]
MRFHGVFSLSTNVGRIDFSEIRSYNGNRVKWLRCFLGSGFLLLGIRDSFSNTSAVKWNKDAERAKRDGETSLNILFVVKLTAIYKSK